MKKNKIDILSLEHEVLKILFHISRMVASRTGIEAEGYVLINKEITVAPIHFGAILAYINFPDKFKRTNTSDFNYYVNLNPTDKQIDAHGLSKYSVELLSDVIDNLALEEQVIDKLENLTNGMYKRTIQLTVKGKVAYTTYYWIKLKEKEEREMKSVESTIKTGKWTRTNMIISGLLAATTTMVVVTNYFGNKAQTLQEDKKEKLESSRQLEMRQDVQELTKQLHQISLILSDTAKAKVKIEK